MATATMTTMVACTSSCRGGHVTLLISVRTSLRKRVGRPRREGAAPATGLVVFGAATALAGTFAEVFVVVVLAIVLRMPFLERLAGQEGFEPPTSGFGDRRSTVGATALRSSVDGSPDSPHGGRPCPLLRLLVRGVRTAPLAELLEFEPLGIVPFVLHRSVVAAFALLARQRYSYAHRFTLS